MSPSDALGVIGVIVVLLLGGVTSLLESAVTSISAARVDTLVKDERPGAARLQRVVDNRAQYINLLVLLRTVWEVSGAVAATAMLVHLLGEDGAWPYITAILLVTVFTFVIIGVLSRTMGRRNPHTITLHAAPILLTLMTLLGPVSKLLVWAGTLFTPGRGFRNGPFASEIELREMVDIASERGIVESDERKMIQSVFDLASTTARTVMVPRPEMVWIEADKTAGQATSLCVRSGHSRLPVIGESVDDIVGVVYLKDLVAQTYHSQDSGQSVLVSEVARPAVFVPDSRLLDDLLEDMQHMQIHIAMLVDEYGAIAGLISIEDILEEIVGEIADEYDATEQAPIEPLGEGAYRVVARLSLTEVEELFNDLDIEYRRAEQGDDALDLPQYPDVAFSDEQHEEVDTVAGLGAFELGRVPIPGAEVTTGGLHFVFEGQRDRRGRLRLSSAIVRRSTQSLERTQ